MGFLIMNSMWTAKPSSPSATNLCPCSGHSSFTCRKFSGPCDPPKFRVATICTIRAFANQKSSKKLTRQREEQINELRRISSGESDGLVDRSSSGVDNVQESIKESSFEKLDAQVTVTIPSRRVVLQACTVTSGLIAALGVIIRQVSHVASLEGWPVLDCSTEVSYWQYLLWLKVSFEMWHLQLVTGLVVLISSCRYFLLKTWPDFAESSEAANEQVLTSLQPLDYLIVAFVPGVSEELLFRGALLPLFGINWKSALVVAALFGVSHLGSGRKYSFAIWATFVGVVYGYATILSSSLVVPMASHAANNLVGGLLWRYASKSSKMN